VQQLWKRLTEKMDETQKITTYKAIIDKIAKHNETVAKDLNAEYLTLAHNSEAQAAEQFYEDWHNILLSFPDRGRLTCYLQREAEARSQWARTFLSGAALIADSIIA